MNNPTQIKTTAPTAVEVRLHKTEIRILKSTAAIPNSIQNVTKTEGEIL